MSSPKYHFFQEELEPYEIFKQFKKCQWSSPEITKCIENIQQELFNHNFKLCRSSNNTLYFSKAGGVNAAYIGTFLNILSINEKIWLWENQFSISAKYITISEYKHINEEKTSIIIGIMHFPGNKEIEYNTSEYKNNDKINKYGIEFPETYDWYVAHGNIGRSTQIKNVYDDSTNDVINDAINKAIKNWNSIKIENQSKFKKNYKDFHPSTEKEYWEYKQKNSK